MQSSSVKSAMRAVTILGAWFGVSVLVVITGYAEQDTEAVVANEIADIDTLLMSQQWNLAIQQAQALQVKIGHSRYAWQVQERLGLAWHGKGIFTAAIPHFEHAIGLAPKEASPHLNLAATLMALGHRGRAYAEYQQAVALDPSSWRARLDYGQALLEFKMLEEAREQLLVAQPGCPDCPEILRALARFYLQAEDFASAIPYLERLYQADSDSIVRVNLATAYLQTDDIDQMVRLLQPFWPSGLSANERLMVLEADRKMGRTSRAVAAVHSLQNGSCVDDNSVFWGIVSLICLDSEWVEEALVAVDRAIHQDPRNATYRNNRVVILTRLGRQAEAEAEWARVLELAPDLKGNRQGSSP